MAQGGLSHLLAGRPLNVLLVAVALCMHIFPWRGTLQTWSGGAWQPCAFQVLLLRSLVIG